MMSKKVEILGVKFNNTTKKEIVDVLDKRINTNQKTFVVTANPEIVMYANQDDDYMQALQIADYIVPDGIGIVLGAKLLRKPLQERVAGFDLMNDILAKANEQSLRVFFLGAKEDIIEKAVQQIEITYPNTHVCGYHHGYFPLEDASITEMVQRANPDITFVALGYPKQEMWIKNNLPAFKKGLFMGVGGSLDVWAGSVKRAPAFWRKLNIEWLYRLIKQPTRWKRMLFLPRFIINVWRTRKTEHRHGN